MNSNKIYFCFKVYSIHQALKTTFICNKNKIVPIFFIQFYIINGFGPNWIIEFRNLLLKKFSKNTLLRLTQIANKNKITINPKINIIDFTKIKNIESKINKLL